MCMLNDYVFKVLEIPYDGSPSHFQPAERLLRQVMHGFARKHFI